MCDWSLGTHKSMHSIWSLNGCDSWDAVMATTYIIRPGLYIVHWSHQELCANASAIIHMALYMICIYSHCSISQDNSWCCCAQYDSRWRLRSWKWLDQSIPNYFSWSWSPQSLGMGCMRIHKPNLWSATGSLTPNARYSFFYQSIVTKYLRRIIHTRVPRNVKTRLPQYWS
jgi:hypothetical protein